MNETLKQLFRDGENGHTESQNQLGDAYFDGNGLKQDNIKAFEWYLRAAEHGHALAQYNVAYAYANGLGTQKNMEKAIEWYGKSAAQGVALAKYILAKLYIDGQYVAQDISKVLDLLQKASDQGLELAQYDIGTIYLEGKIVLADIENGIKYLTLAADQGHKDAQFNLGLAYTNLSEPDYDIAEKYLQEASYNGHFTAMKELCRLYTIYKKDYAKGLLWTIVALEYCEKEAEQRFKRIKNNLHSKLSSAECDAISNEAKDIIARLDASLC
ncbi:MAG: tetratricopeptide repeat protein [Candidatus Cloacimonas sp.]|nr:tetratricopeptide repeat protein [Candidatus Cloacimonas sp.]